MKIGENHIQCWNRAAKKYSMHFRKAGADLQTIYQPAVDELLGNVSGKHILDAGCSEGYYSRKFALKNALVTGIDGSKNMIAIAKSKNREIEINYQVMDLTQRLDFKNYQFDIVLANMVLMDIPKIDVAIAEFARILKKNGSLIFSITHPCFFCYDWVSNEKGAKLYKPISSYLKEKVEELNFWGKTLHYHRPLSYYFSILEQNSFRVTSLREPVPSGDLLKKYPDWEFHRRIPSFIVAKAMLYTNKSG